MLGTSSKFLRANRLFVFLLVGLNSVSFATYLFSPRHRDFSYDDPSLLRKYVSRESISFIPLTASIVITVPLCFCAFKEALDVPINGTALLKHVFSLFFSISFAMMVVNILKVSVGRLRPDFVERYLAFPPSLKGESHVVVEGRKSFPSGHTCASVIAATHMAAENLASVPGERIVSALFLLVFGVLAPSAYSVLVGLTRILDNRHHLSDVVAGGILGLMCASVSLFYFCRKK